MIKQLKIYLSSIVVGVIFSSGSVIAQSETNLSLGAILALSPASLIDTTDEEVPATVYTYSSEELRKSTAEDITEFFQRNVPGSDVRGNPWNNVGIGFRGIMTNRAENTLFNINGEMQNARGRDGVVGESVLGLFDDVQQIDVVVGPGSVTHGPGAISGVINYTLKDGIKEMKGSQVELKTGSNSQQVQYSYVGKSEDENHVYRISAGLKTQKDQKGEWGGWDQVTSSDGNTPGLLTKDHSFEGLDLEHAMRVTTVYTNKSAKVKAWFRYFDVVWYPHQLSDISNTQWGGENFGRGYFQKSLSAVAEKRVNLKDNFELKTTLGTTTTVFGINAFKSNQNINGTTADRGEFIESLAETRVRLRADLTSKINPKSPWALGAEIRSDDLGNSVLGKHEKLGVGNHADVGNQPYVKTSYLNTALFGEVQFKGLKDGMKVVLGARYDQHTRVNTFAPRLGLLFFDEEKKHNVRVVYQVAQRTGSADDYEVNRFTNAGVASDRKYDIIKPAENKSVEIGYKHKLSEYSHLDIVTFYNDITNQEWNDTSKSTVNKKEDTKGAEILYEVKKDRTKIRLSHSFVTLGKSDEDAPTFFSRDNKTLWNYQSNITRFMVAKTYGRYDIAVTGAYLWGMNSRQDVIDARETHGSAENMDWIIAPTFKLDLNIERELESGILGLDLKNIAAIVDRKNSLDHTLIEDPASDRYATAFETDLPSVKVYYTVKF